MSFRRTRAMARKEFLHILRDPWSLIMALAIPLLLLLLFSYALSLDVDRVPTAVYDQDRTPESRELISRLAGSRYFEVTMAEGGYRQLDRQIDTGKTTLGVVIPLRFAADLKAGRPLEMQLLLDGTDSNTGSIAKNYAESVLALYAFEQQAAQIERRLGRPPGVRLDARVRVWYNSELKSRNFIIPGLIAVILMIIAALLTSLTIAREWENGSMEQLLSTPLRPVEMLLGKLSAYFALGVVDTLTAIIVGVLFFGVPFRGSLLLLAASCGLFLFGALSWGIFLSAVARSQLLAYQMGLLSSFLPAFLLSGFIYAIENMPRVIQPVTYLFPARYFITILKSVFLKGVGLEVLWTQLVFLAVYSVVVFTLAARKLGTKVA
jgi:ABC-2 type transport system permease protein